MISRRELLKLSGAVADMPRISCAADETAFIDSILAPGGNITIPAGSYNVDYIRPRSNSIINVEPGTVFTRNASPFSLLELNNVRNVELFCNDAVFNGLNAANQSSHTVKLLGTRYCTIYDPQIIGTKEQKDGIYIGLGDSECYQSHIKGGLIDGAHRNGVSFIAAIRCSIEDMTIKNTIWRHGVGVEANTHDYLNIENRVRNCTAHDNAGVGFACTFGDYTLFDGNVSHNNLHGIITASGGNTRKVGFRRKGYDSAGILNFDSQTGFIDVAADLSLLQPGTWIYLKSQNGGVFPGGLREQRYHVSETDNGIRLENKTKFFSEAIGSFNADPDISSFYIDILGKQGQSYGTRIVNNNCYNNKDRDIWCTTSGGVEVINNIGKVDAVYCEGIEIA